MGRKKKQPEDFQLSDLNNIRFGSNKQEIIAALTILKLVLYTENNATITEICKIKIEEGLTLLNKLGFNEEVTAFKKGL